MWFDNCTKQYCDFVFVLINHAALFWGHTVVTGYIKKMAILFICLATTFCFNRKYISWGKKNIFANTFIFFHGVFDIKEWVQDNVTDCNSAPGPKKDAEWGIWPHVNHISLCPNHKNHSWWNENTETHNGLP